ncbi:MAG: DNA circularization N-terminal domain-containing protein [Candidatus Anammoxibacter sp.]
MSVFSELQEASYRGVTFLVPNETKEGGKKIVEHNYPGNDRRFVEELGKQPNSYRITAIVFGSDAIQRRIRLEQALTETGRGLLIHPTLGQIQVVATTFSSRSSDSELGKFTFDIEFLESEENITLSPGATNNQLVSVIKSDVSKNLDIAFLNKFKDSGFADILKGTSTQFRGLITDINIFKDGIQDPTAKGLSALNRLLELNENNAPITVRTAKGYVTALRDIYNTFENVSGNVGGFQNAWFSLTDFGNNRVKKTLITAKRIEEEINLSAVEDHTRVNALAGAYESATFREYKTDVELLDVQIKLEDKYADIVEDALDDSLANAPDVRQSINDLRVKSREVFEQKIQNVWRVVDIETNETSLPLLTHRFYGDHEKLDALKDLNRNINFAIFDQNIKGLT